MLPPAQSPIHALVYPWWTAGGRLDHLPTRRRELATAILAELHANADVDYDPFLDHRIKWAIQHIAVSAGDLPRVDTAIRLNASLLLEPTPFLSRKDLAAGAA